MRAIQSVIIQGADILEIVIIDDHSEVEIQAEELGLNAQEIQIIICRNAINLGVAASRNVGLEKASGEYVMFLDDDDVLLPDMVSRSLDAIQRNDADIVSCRCEVMGEAIKASKRSRYNRQQQGRLAYYQMDKLPMEHLCLYAPQIHTFLVRREAIGSVRFVESLTYGEDIDFWLALAAQGLRFKKLDFIGCYYHLSAQSATNRSAYRAKADLYNRLIKKWRDHQVVVNLCRMKLAYLSLRQGRPGNLLLIFQLLLQPVLTLRHAVYYIKSL